ncbi:hypothetical protein [Clostridium sp. ATCC 25772]|uniref:hypothetical protein n=1 Tax=Clostridium sp. ATCC 25772 TaxID=1676991 RepID=UPI00138F48B6|nr:hypothetical protein [Clostridium sp. ATCC 25772]
MLRHILIIDYHNNLIIKEEGAVFSEIHLEYLKEKSTEIAKTSKQLIETSNIDKIKIAVI